MGVKFNILKDLGIDFVGTSGGSPSGPAERYFATFNNTTDWTLSSPNYVRTITAATHGKGVNPSVSVFELNGSDYELVNVGITISNIGDVTISVSETPNNRFNGLILII